MNYEEKELKNILNREKIESVDIQPYGVTILTEDHEIEIGADTDDSVILSINKREFVE